MKLLVRRPKLGDKACIQPFIAMAMLLLLLLPSPRNMDRSSSKRYEMITWGWRRHCMIAVSKKQLITAAVGRDMHEPYAQHLPKTRRLPAFMLMQCVLAVFLVIRDPVACMSDHPMIFYLSMFYRAYAYSAFKLVRVCQKENAKLKLRL